MRKSTYYISDLYLQVLKADEKTRLVKNIASHLKDAQEFIQKRTVGNFTKCDAEYGRRIQQELDAYKVNYLIIINYCMKRNMEVLILKPSPSFKK